MRTLMKKNGFTLVELLVVMGIIGILIGLLFPAIGAARNAANKARAQTEVKAIATAIEAYFSDYNKLPMPDSIQGVEGEKGTYYSADYSGGGDLGSQQIIKILTANDVDDQGKSTLEAAYKNVMNPRKRVFLETQNAGSPQDIIDGVFLDPWGEQYLIALDSDYNGKMELFTGDAAGEIITKNVIVYSLGPNQELPPNNAILPNPAYPNFIASHYE